MFQYRYLDDLTYADAAFEVEGNSCGEVFQGAADALLRLMVEDIAVIQPRARREVQLRRPSGNGRHRLEELLHEFLEKIIYWKDADQLLLRARKVELRDLPSGKEVELRAELSGETIDPRRQNLGTDVKAVTFHRLRVWRVGDLWKAIVVVDV